MSRFLEALFAGNKPNGGSKRAAAILLVLITAALLALLLFNITSVPAILREAGGYLSYKFVRRALIAGSLVSLCSALLGVTLVLKRYSMIGDGLSHVGFGALSVAAAMGFVTAGSLPGFLPEGLRNTIAGWCAAIAARPLPFTLVVVIIAAFFILRMSGNGAIKGDAAIALLSTASLAVGIMVTSMTSGMNVEVMNYMFGSILAIDSTDVILTVVLSLVVLIVYVLYCNRLFAVTFDESFASASGIKSGRYNAMIAVMTSVTIVIGMRMMGTMLISSLIVFPALSSMRLFSHFRAVLFSASIISVVCFVLGIMLSCLCAFPVGAGIVLVNLFVFVVFSLIGKIRS